MLRRLLSDDLPGSRLLSASLLVIVLGLALAPFLFPGSQSLNAAAKICYFIVLVASYDLLLGYTGIVSFAHTMFFGIGAYGAGIALYAMGPTWTAIGIGAAVALVLSVLLALLIGLFSLRVRAIFFSMITLAVASVFAILASQLGELTGGEDGREQERCGNADADRGPGRAEPGDGDGDAVAADAEEHGVREGDDAGVAEEEVVGGDEDDEDADVGGRAERLAAGEQERRSGKPDQHQGEDRRQHARARRIARQEVVDHERPTGNSPCGRHTSTRAMTAMFETSASFGARKPT